MPSFILSASFEALFTLPYGIIGGLICISVLMLLIIMVMRMGYGDTGEYDKERNFIYFQKGTYGTSGFMSEKTLSIKISLCMAPAEELYQPLKLTSSLKRIYCIPALFLEY